MTFFQRPLLAARSLHWSWFAVLFVSILAAQGDLTNSIHYERILTLQPPPTASYGHDLIHSRDGRIFGTLFSRNSYAGSLFTVGTDGQNYTIVYSSSTNRLTGILEGSDGRIYGNFAGDPFTNTAGIFSIDANGSNFVVLRTFSPGRPQFNLVQDTDGWLFGTSSDDGIGYGTVFRLSPHGESFQVLHQFQGMATGDGALPGALTLGRDGWLYGCTFYGGSSSNAGTIFKLERDGSGYLVLHRFGGGAQGNYPTAGRPLLLNDDRIYGAANGGARRAGIIFKIGKNGGDFQIIHEFEGEDGTGDSPIGGLIEWRDGALYGATYDGGIDGAGTIFRLNKNGTGFGILRIYIDEPDPRATDGSPQVGLLSAADGRIYGITSGGDFGEGTLFRFSPLPVLQLQQQSESMALAWTESPETFDLEQSDLLGVFADWKHVEAASEVTNFVRHVILPRSAETRFFRLRKL